MFVVKFLNLPLVTCPPQIGLTVTDTELLGCQWLVRKNNDGLLLLAQRAPRLPRPLGLAISLEIGMLVTKMEGGHLQRLFSCVATPSAL